MKTREDALELLCRYNQSDSLIKHALAVEGVMRHFARTMQGDEDYWGMIGLLHDLDYERFPDEHCFKSQEILEQEGFSPELIRAVISHGYGIVNDVKPEKDEEKVLYATDELTGLITAAALMRPSKSLMDLEVKSVRKKYKQPSFAAGVNRQVIEDGAAMLGVSVEELIKETILGMREVAEDLGLK